MKFLVVMVVSENRLHTLYITEDQALNDAIIYRHYNMLVLLEIGQRLLINDNSICIVRVV